MNFYFLLIPLKWYFLGYFWNLIISSLNLKRMSTTTINVNSTATPSSSVSELQSEAIRRLWYQMFLSTLISSIILHSIGSLVLFIRLRKNNRYTRWLIFSILLAGVFTPLVLGSVNNILIASILVFSGNIGSDSLPFYSIILIGLCQTIIVLLIGFLKILQTL